MERRPVALIILDGWGNAPEGPGNAVRRAKTPVFDELYAANPSAQLSASGLDVGLPEGQMGNSEVGHLNLGAGRIVYQDLTRIDKAVESGELLKNQALVGAAERASKTGVMHIIGLCSFGGVHSNLSHIVELASLAATQHVREVRVHAITDGRDVSPSASLTDIPWLEDQLRELESKFSGFRAHIVSVIGRYWAMDRDRRWDRTERAFELFTERRGKNASTASEAVKQSHASGVTDEFIEPWTIGSEREPSSSDFTSDGSGINAADTVIFANFRPDRMRQIVSAFTEPQFTGFERAPGFEVLKRAVTLTEYEAHLPVEVAFPPQKLVDSLADVIATAGLGQLHVAETEKYPHVTYFFNGGVETIHPQEYRSMAQSPREVATYDQKPEMAADQVADLFCSGFARDDIQFGIINFANPDMVGHTGVIKAAIQACETVDSALERVVECVHARGGVCVITADHGNAEQMLTEAGTPHTAHTTNRVPIIITTQNHPISAINDGILADVAPTILSLLKLDQPTAMTGRSLIAGA